jgi:hypothetical protein
MTLPLPRLCPHAHRLCISTSCTAACTNGGQRRSLTLERGYTSTCTLCTTSPVTQRSGPAFPCTQSNRACSIPLWVSRVSAAAAHEFSNGGDFSSRSRHQCALLSFPQLLLAATPSSYSTASSLTRSLLWWATMDLATRLLAVTATGCTTT